ncbi:MAG: deoxyribonuclease, partial [Bacteroidetes bacterium QH_8_67_23]
MSTPVQHGDTVTLDIEKFADEGKGLARVRGGLVVFVPKAV